MNKSELVEVTAKEAGITKAAAEKALAAIIGAVVKTVTQGESVTLVGFGTFKQVARAARTGFNPQAGEKIKIAAQKVPKFVPGAAFKAAVDPKAAKRKADKAEKAAAAKPAAKKPAAKKAKKA